MKRVIAVVLVLIIMVSGYTIAEDWVCPVCGNNASKNFCNECGTPKPVDDGNWTCTVCGSESSGKFCSECGSPRQAQASVTIPSDIKATECIVRNYVGLNLSACGYTSMGGERRDKYGSSNLLLALVTTDDTWIDPEDSTQIAQYKVLAQYPAANTKFNVTSNSDGKSINMGFGEIVLVVGKTNEKASVVPTFETILPSPYKGVHYLRDYKGRLLETVGYTSLGGDRFDKYGPSGLVQIIIMDEDGMLIDPNNEDNFKYYVITDQSTAPNTKLEYTYETGSDGSDKLIFSSLSAIQITVKMTEVGKYELAAKEAYEAEQRASGNLRELYKGTYVVGTDLQPGNYEFYCVDPTDSCSVYTYLNKAAYDDEDGEWGYIWHDSEYVALRDGMYFEVSGSPINALRKDFATNEKEFDLYSGVYNVGQDINPGTYVFTQITDSCSLYLYNSKSDYIDEDGDWMYLYGEGDKEVLQLKTGMVLTVSGGAAHAVAK